MPSKSIPKEIKQQVEDIQVVASFPNWPNGLYNLKIESPGASDRTLQMRPIYHAHAGTKTRNHADSRPTR